MDDATFTSNTNTAAMNRRRLLEQLAIIRSLFRKESSAADDDAAATAAARNRNVVEGRVKEGVRLINDQMAAVSTELLLTVMSDMMLLRLLDGLGLEEGRAVASSDVASDQQLTLMDADAAKKKKVTAKQKEKKKRYKRNKAAAKHKNKNKTTKLMSWMGGGLISLLALIAFGSIMTFVVPLSLIHQTDGSGEGNAPPPSLPPSASKPLRRKDHRLSNDNAASGIDVARGFNHPLAAVVPPPVFSPSAVSVSNRRMRSDANTTFNDIERNALIDFYDSANGAEWTNTTNWLDEDASYCYWWGVTCDEKGHVTYLFLANNGLSGRLSKSIGNLTFIKMLDLSDNDMKGSIPEEIGLLSNLWYLRLSYNAFSGAVPESLRELTKLQMLQLQSNRITKIPYMLQLDESVYGYSAFVSDCGDPSIFDEVLECDYCTMCCNANDDCRPQEDTQVAERFKLRPYSSVNYSSANYTADMIGICIGITLIEVFFRYLFDMRKNRRNAERGLEEDDKFPLDRFCKDSVYSYFATDSVAGWLIAATTLGLQVWMYVLILGIIDNKINIPFTWKCPRNSTVCNYTVDFTDAGWITFTLLVTIYLAKDLIEADKLLSHSYKSRHSLRSRIQCLIGGMGLFSVTVFAWIASISYTAKTATSDADLVLKALTVLFVTQLDEKVSSALEACNEKWAMKLDKWIFARLGACNQKWTAHAPDSEDASSDSDASSDTDAEKGSTIEEIKREIETQQAQISDQQNELMRQKMQIEQMALARRFGELTELQEAVQNMQESQEGSCASFETIFYCDPNANESVTSNADAVESEEVQLDADAGAREGGKTTMNGTKIRNHNRKIRLDIRSRRGRPSKLNASSSGYTRLDSETVSECEGDAINT